MQVHSEYLLKALVLTAGKSLTAIRCAQSLSDAKLQHWLSSKPT